ncbi:MAG: SDR family oxidoreductase [Acidobacteriota bacterium]|nr:SDR family oxidoreductase [Acidobacteriota bacterium]
MVADEHEQSAPRGALSGVEPSLAGKVAVVTGAASGIGLASGRALATRGARVLCVDVDAEGARRAAEELRGVPLVADVSSVEQWGEVARMAADLGGADIALLNAGVTTGEEDVTAFTDDQYRRIMGVNVGGVVFGLRALVPQMAEKGAGAVVATASMAGLIAFPGDPLYTATKHAVVGFVRAVAPRLADQGILVNAVCPSLVDTPLIDGPIRETLAGAGFPLISAEQVAEAVVHCLGSGRSGEAVFVQLGWPPTAYRFGHPPGPRQADAQGRVPPGWLAEQPS